MRHCYMRAAAGAALVAAVAGAAFAPGKSLLAATSTWIDPADPTGIGNDPNAATNLNGIFKTAAHWNGGVPGTSDIAIFNVPAYPMVPYTVSFTQDTTVNQIDIVNDPVTFHLAGFSLFANQVPFNFNDCALFIGDQGSLTVSNGTVVAQSLQVGSTSGSGNPAHLSIDGTAGTTNFYTGDNGTVANYQAINVSAGGALILSNGTFVNQAPDLATTGNNFGQIVLNGLNSGLFIGDGVTISGGALHVNNGFVAPTGSSLTCDSLLYDGDLFINVPNVTTNLRSNLFDSSSNIIPATITGVVNASQGFLNISGAVVRVTPDSGTTWHAFLTAGTVQTSITNSVLTTGDMFLDGDPSPAAGSITTIDPSLVTVHGDMVVGNFGVAALNVTNGANLISVDGALIVGDRPTGNGTLVVDGLATVTTDANITNSTYGFGELIVGKQGVGNMTLSGGAHAVVGGNFAAWIGQNDNGDGTGGNGALTVTGAATPGLGNITVPSALTVSNGDLFVGSDNHTRGVLNILNGGTVTDLASHIAESAGSTGNVTVDGSFSPGHPSTWTNNAYLVVANAGNGTLIIRNGGLVTNTVGYIAPLAGSTGSVLIDNATWNNSDFFEVGDAGHATLTLQNNATLTNTSANLSFFSTGVSNVTVNHATWTNSTFMTLGEAGTANLTIQNLGNVSTGSSLVIAHAAGSHGTLLIDGAGSHLSVGTFLTVGTSGTGNLTLQNNASATAGNSLDLAEAAGSNGTLTVNSHSALSALSFITIAEAGHATALVNAGSSLSAGTSLVVGDAPGSSGTLDIETAGTLVSASTFVTIGNKGTGQLLIQFGASFTDNGSAFIGADTGGIGNVVVSSNNSLWSVANGLAIGSSGTGNGTLTIQNHGAVAVSGAATFLGGSANATGTLFVTGVGSQLTSAIQFAVAVDGTANATIAAGGLVTCAPGASPSGTAGVVGQEATAVGTLTITDPGSRLLASGNFNVGGGNNGVGTTNGGNGTLAINNGGLLSDINGYVGRWTGSVGAATLSGANSTWQNTGSLFIAANDLANNPNHANLSSGTGSATINTGATISVANSTLIGPAGTLTLAGGSLASPAITNNGLLKGNGTLTGNLTNNASLQISTSNTITLSGTYFQPITGALSGNGTLVAQSLFGTITSVPGAIQIRTNGSSSGTSNVTLLNLVGSTNNWTGKVDLTNNKLIIEPSAAASRSTLLSNFQNQVAYGTSHNAGLLSSTLPANFAVAVLDNALLNKTTFGGLPVDANAILISQELLGDSNIDGTVNAADLNTVLNNFGTTTPAWTSGNFDHAPTINLTDLSYVLNNFGQSNPNASASQLPITDYQLPTPTPEPTSLALLSLGTAALFTRRRKN